MSGYHLLTSSKASKLTPLKLIVTAQLLAGLDYNLKQSSCGSPCKAATRSCHVRPFYDLYKIDMTLETIE